MEQLLAELKAAQQETPGSEIWLECLPKEHRTAKALEAQGLINVSPKGFAGYFEISLNKT